MERPNQDDFVQITSINAGEIVIRIRQIHEMNAARGGKPPELFFRNPQDPGYIAELKQTAIVLSEQEYARIKAVLLGQQIPTQPQLAMMPPPPAPPPAPETKGKKGD